MADERYGAAESALMRHETYARGMRRLTLAVTASSLAAAVAIGVAGYAVFSKPEPRYFATQVTGQILPLVPIDRPHLTEAQVTNFAVEAVTRALTIDFANWKQDLSDAKIYFQNPEGYDRFLSALTSSGNLDLIRNNRMSSSAVANGAVIVARGLSGEGRYTWRLEIPLEVTYLSSSDKRDQSMIAFVEVVRLPTYENPYGVGVSRFIARPA
jgi:intracellular multiplication protein IcmL